jgi:hypothetical protein
MSTAVMVVAVLLLAVTPARADVDCDAARCAVQSTIDAQCDCAAATTHGDYVRCVAHAVNELVEGGTLPVACKGKVRRCASRSVCGKRAGFVVCDLPVRCPVGTCSRCRLAPSAERCLARGGTVSSRPSCCASCQPPGATPCGPVLTCDGASEVCVSREPVGPAIVYDCRPVPVGCELDRTCACAGASFCQPPFDVCNDTGVNAIDCVCPLCQ